MGDAVFFGLEFGVGVLLDRVVALVADADFLVVFDVFIPVALGVQEDLFRPFFVFDAHEYGAGFVRWQWAEVGFVREVEHGGSLYGSRPR